MARTAKPLKKCSIEGCDKLTRSSGCEWCGTHYYRFRRNGDPEKLLGGRWWRGRPTVLKMQSGERGTGPGPHGNENPLYTWFYENGCRCDECVSANASYHKQYHILKKNDEKYKSSRNRCSAKRMSKIKADVESGRSDHLRETLSRGMSGYANGCRCQECSDGHKRYWRENYRNTRQILLAERVKMVGEIKTGRGCCDCGYNENPDAMDFDHVRGEKKSGIANMMIGPIEKLLDEMEKCDVRCARCHAIRTVERNRDMTQEQRTEVFATNSKPDSPDWRVMRNRKRNTEWMRQRRKDDLEFVSSLKCQSGCVDCGYRDSPHALQFDHVRGDKIKNVGGLIGQSRSKLLAEISKCEIVCTNCHRIRTFARKRAAHTV